MNKEQIWKAIEAYRSCGGREEYWRNRDVLDIAIDEVFDRIAEQATNCIKTIDAIAAQRDALAAKLAEIAQPSQALQVVARLLRVCEGRTDSEALEIAAMLLGEPVREPLTDARIIEIAVAATGAEPGRDGYILPISFARAIEKEIRG